MSERNSTPEDVHGCYRLLLGREPEYPQALIDRALTYPSRVALVSSFLHTLEFQLRHGSRLDGRLDIGLLSEFAAPGLQGRADYVTDFLGGLTRTGVLAWAHDKGGQVEAPPVLGNLFGSLPEWLAVLAAVKAAAERGRQRFVAVEIGAAWGPWLVAAGLAARSKQIDAVRLVGVEPAPELCAVMREHLSVNGFTEEETTVIQAAVIPGAEAAEHPILAHPSIEFGHRSAPRPSAKRSRDGWRSCKTVDVQEIFSQEPEIDLLVLTTGGEEREILSSIDLTTGPVRAILLSTHTPRADLEIWEMLSAAKWRNVVSQPCEIQQDGADPAILHTLRDGCQLWIRTTD
ncbi:hypothetical protein DDF62_11270 [Caulobacter radicis]|uniref:hypothetical protein n=1 Tax=Caulobacter radicis TaxID=2172650 RepID=UPI000D571C99|nr:hypothetical protein [Caulobacter radicis]PVM89681.1 hypothetical protein DDF62_11270 [Caulobacter radicis]